jgi:hypothetical protein
VPPASPPPYQRDPRVDAYIDALPDWQQAICRDVRDLVHEADPEVEETVKRRRVAHDQARGTLSARCVAVVTDA